MNHKRYKIYYLVLAVHAVLGKRSSNARHCILDGSTKGHTVLQA